MNPFGAHLNRFMSCDRCLTGYSMEGGYTFLFRNKNLLFEIGSIVWKANGNYYILYQYDEWFFFNFKNFFAVYQIPPEYNSIR
jgi:hypothetical protein